MTVDVDLLPHIKEVVGLENQDCLWRCVGDKKKI